MALPKPPKPWYTLEEVAAEFEWSEDDLWDYAEQGKLDFCFLFKDTWATLQERGWATLQESEWCGWRAYEANAIGRVKLNGPYPIHPDNVPFLRKENRGREPIYSLFQTIEMFQATQFADSFPPPSSPEVGYEFAIEKPCMFSIVITHKEKIRFKNWISSQEALAMQQDCLSLELPSDHQEKKLIGKPAIAKYIGEKYTGGYCSVSTVRIWMKEGLPYTKELNGRVTAEPSLIDEWRKKRATKK